MLICIPAMLTCKVYGGCRTRLLAWRCKLPSIVCLCCKNRRDRSKRMQLYRDAEPPTIKDWTSWR